MCEHSSCHTPSSLSMSSVSVHIPRLLYSALGLFSCLSPSHWSLVTYISQDSCSGNLYSPDIAAETGHREFMFFTLLILAGCCGTRGHVESHLATFLSCGHLGIEPGHLTFIEVWEFDAPFSSSKNRNTIT